MGVDALRQACGGHGFLANSGFLEIWEGVTPYPTYEGVNVVMMQQSSRLLIKNAAKIYKGKSCKDFFEYLNHTEKLLGAKSQATTVDEFRDLGHLSQAMATRSAYCVKETYKMIAEKNAPKKTWENELFAVDVQHMTRVHLQYIMLEITHKRIRDYPFKDKNIRPLLELLLKIFVLDLLRQNHHELLVTGFMNKNSTMLLREAFLQSLTELRPHMIPLVEFCPIAEANLLSTIGNKYGDIYETQFDVGRQTRLNKPVPPYYDSLMKPVMRKYPAPKVEPAPSPKL